MRFGTKILLLMLLITVGTSATLAWVVTLHFTNFETQRTDERISQAIRGYVTHLEDRQRQVERIIRALLEAPAARSQLQAAEDARDTAALEQLRQEIFGRTVQTELDSPDGSPAFHVLVNQAAEVLISVAPGDELLEKALSDSKRRWLVDPILTGADPVIYYFSIDGQFFVAMGVPLRTQLDELPTHAYFVGMRVNDEWVRRQLVAERVGLAASDAPLSAWFIVDGKIMARGSSDRRSGLTARDIVPPAMRPSERRTMPTTGTMGRAEAMEFDRAGERYVGQAFQLNSLDPTPGTLVLASSLDRALVPLRSLQQQIVVAAAVTCLLAIIACLIMARGIAQPIRELVEGTQRIGAGHFDHPVSMKRRDELGKLAEAFNDMAEGLKERDSLRDERIKIERDLALARKIQMDILPKHIPPCPGYDIAAYSLPAEQTGGDIYDLVAAALDSDDPQGPAGIVLLLADATGHGMGPALSVTQVRAMLRIGVRLRASLDDVLHQINRQLCEDLGAERFVTAFLGVLDPVIHCVNYHSAGQAPLLHFRARDAHFAWLESSTLPLGIDEEPEDAGVQQMKLEHGDLVVLLTDGFYECRNAKGEEFGKDRVAEVILKHRDQPAKLILSELLAATGSFTEGTPQADDMTALIIKRQKVHDAEAPGVSPGMRAGLGAKMPEERTTPVSPVSVG